jgi:hypothetical protein
MKKFEVIKEFAGIKKGEKINVNPVRQKHMLDAGYIKPIKTKVAKEKKATKLDPIEKKKLDK